MRKNLLLVATILLISLTTFAQKGFKNPAAAYCQLLGYNYSIKSDKQGNDVGICTLPNGQQVNAWDFYKGKVAQEFSYAAKKGYSIETVVEKGNGYTVEKAVCTKSNKGVQESLTLEELMAKNGDQLQLESRGSQKDAYEIAKDNPNFVMAKSTPTSFDWRSYNGHAYIGSVRDQGTCGSCYSFGASACAEGVYNFATGKYDSNTADFAESYIVWCLGSMSAYSGNFGGCDGADYTYSELQALCDIGTIDETYFPYSESTGQSCPSAASSATKTKFNAWYRVTCSDIDAIKTAIMTYGVVDAAVYVTTAFQNYTSGIYTDSYTTCSSSPCYNTPTNHAIALVGWGNDATYGDYWILRNSWGSSWGESGYMRIKATSARVACEVCYLTYTSSTVTVPTVTTTSASSISTTSAVSGGNVTANGGATVTASGIVYSTSTTPTLTSGTVLSTSPVTTSGSYSLTMSSLTAGTTYYVRAYATNSAGTAYGSQVSFTTSTTTDTQAPTVPTNLASASVTSSSATLSWTASTDNVGVTGYKIYQNGTLLTSTTSTSYTVSGLSASTTYTFYVIAYDAAGNVSTASSTLSVTTSAASVTYCTSSGSNYSYEWISKVVIGSMTNSSSAAGYTDFTSVTCSLAAGTGYSITLTPGFASTTYSEYWKIFVDLNGDGDFADTGETVFDAGATSKTAVTGTLTIPSGTTAITTRMRVSMKYNGSQTSCEAFSYGEVEDYTVVISAGTADTQVPTAPTSLASASITSTSFTLSWTASTDNVGVTGYKIYQNGSLLTSTASTSYNVTGLTASTTYTYYVQAYDAAGNVSTASSTLSVTTSASGGTSDITVGTGTSVQGFPLNCYYGYERSAAIYTVSEVGSAGTINKLAWYSTVTTSYSVPVKIYIKQTTSSTITASTWATLTSGATLVYSGTMAGTTASAWKVFTLTTAFSYTAGTNNLMVLVETNYGGTGAGNSTGPGIRYTSATSKHMYVRADNSAPTGTGTVTSYRPNIKLTITKSSTKNDGLEQDEVIISDVVTAYPNPTTGIVTVKSEKGIKSINVFSVTGAKVYSNSDINDEASKEIDLSNFNSGMYIIVVNDGVKNHSIKITKQ